MATGSYLSIITLKVNGLNASIKRQYWLNGYKNKTTTYICCLQETHLKTRDTYRLKVKGWKNIFHANRDQKKAGVAILISDKTDLKTNCEKRQRRKLHNDQNINPRRYNNYKYICTQHKSTAYVRQMITSMKGEINNNTIIVGDFNT